MNYKYENVETVEAQDDFELYKHDEDGEVIDTVVIKKGTRGIVESMGFSIPGVPEPHYDILFITDSGDINACIYESKMEQLFNLS
jgi:hypothetical protein